MPRRFLVRSLRLVGLLVFVACSREPPVVRIFVANQADDSVSVIDGALDREVQIIPVGRAPQAIALRTAAPPLVAISNNGASTVTLIDPVGLAVAGDPVKVGRRPEGVAFSPDGTLLFAASPTDHSVAVIDVATRMPRRDPIPFAKEPLRVVAMPDGHLLVLIHDKDGEAALVEPATGSLLAKASVGPFPSDAVVTRDGRRILVASFDAQTLTVLDAATLAQLDRYSIEIGYGLVLHPSKPLLYSMRSFEGEIGVVDIDARRDVGTITVGAWPNYSAITPDGRNLYVVNNDANNVVRVDTESRQTVVRIAVGSEPVGAVVWVGGRG